MKTIRVVAAIIKAVNENGEPVIFATQRGYGDFKTAVGEAVVDLVLVRSLQIYELRLRIKRNA